MLGGGAFGCGGGGRREWLICLFRSYVDGVNIQDEGLCEAFVAAFVMLLQDDAEDLLLGAFALAEDAQSLGLALFRGVFGFECRFLCP